MRPPDDAPCSKIEALAREALDQGKHALSANLLAVAAAEMGGLSRLLFATIRPFMDALVEVHDEIAESN